MDQHLQRLMPIKCIFISGNCWAATGFLDVRRIKKLWDKETFLRLKIKHFCSPLAGTSYLKRPDLWYFCFLCTKKVTKVCTTYFPIWLIKGKKSFTKGKDFFVFFPNEEDYGWKNFDDGDETWCQVWAKSFTRFHNSE